MFDIDKVRSDFPELSEKVNGRDLIYMDNAATSLMPEQVIQRITDYYSHEHSNIHRGIHRLSENATMAYEDAREKVRAFINADSSSNIIFTHGTTESINMIAQGLESLCDSGTRILVSSMEHHSNFLPWQELAKRAGAGLEIIRCPGGGFDIENFKEMLAPAMEEGSTNAKLVEGMDARLRETGTEKAACRIRLIVAVTQTSNLTGTTFPIQEITRLTHEAGGLVIIDGAQGIRHENFDAKKVQADFYCFSGHKMLGPTGIGVLYGSSDALKLLKPSFYGGGMVDVAGDSTSVYYEGPRGMEAGTPNISGALALAKAIGYLESIGLEVIRKREKELTERLTDKLEKIKGVHVVGEECEISSSVVSITIDGMNTYDAAAFLDRYGIATRSGTMCAQPGLRELGVESVVRISPAFYNTFDEIDKVITAIENIAKMA